MFNNIVQNIFDSICLHAQRLVATFLSFILSSLELDNFRPDLTYLKTNIIGEGNLLAIMKFTSRVGYFIMITLAVFGIAKFFTSAFQEVRDDLKTIAIRFFLCFIIVYQGPTIMDALLTDANARFSDAVETFGTRGSDGELSNLAIEGKTSFMDSINDTMNKDTTFEEDGENFETEYEEVNSFKKNTANSLGDTFIVLTFAPLIAIIRIILYLVICYSLIKLAFEMVRRYIMMCILYMGFPAAVGTYITKETSPIFVAYCKMFFTEALLLVFTRIWVSLSLFLMENVAASLVGSLIIMAFINAGVKLEQLFKDMGANTASTGGALLDTMAVTAGGLFMSARSLKGVGGASLVNAGGMFGSPGMAAIGRGLLNGDFSVQGGVDSMSTSLGGRLREATSNLSTGGKSNGLPATSGMANSISNLMRGEYKEQNSALKAFNGMSDIAQSQVLDMIKGKNFSNAGKNSLASIMGTKDINFTALTRGGYKGVAQWGSNGSRGFTISSTPAGKESKEFIDANGNKMYLSWDGTHGDASIGNAKISEEAAALGLDVNEIGTEIDQGITRFDENSLASQIESSGLSQLYGADGQQLANAMACCNDTNLDNFSIQTFDDGSSAIFHYDDKIASITASGRGEYLDEGPIQKVKNGDLFAFEAEFKSGGRFAQTGFKDINDVAAASNNGYSAVTFSVNTEDGKQYYLAQPTVSTGIAGNGKGQNAGGYTFRKIKNPNAQKS